MPPRSRAVAPFRPPAKSQLLVLGPARTKSRVLGKNPRQTESRPTPDEPSVSPPDSLQEVLDLPHETSGETHERSSAGRPTPPLGPTRSQTVPRALPPQAAHTPRVSG